MAECLWLRSRATADFLGIFSETRADQSASAVRTFPTFAAAALLHRPTGGYAQGTAGANLRTVAVVLDVTDQKRTSMLRILDDRCQTNSHSLRVVQSGEADHHLRNISRPM